MMERVSVDFARRIYNLLTMSSDDVNFYCVCLQNQNREAATNNPVEFALKLIKINVLCRLPKIKDNLFSVYIGKSYLSSVFVRPEIPEIASGMLDNRALVTDVFGSALAELKSDEEFFAEIENELEIKGFAKLRKKYDTGRLELREIYEKISSELHRLVDWKPELSLAEKRYIPNKYVIRMIEIASCNGLTVTAVADTSYPSDFVRNLLARHNIKPNRLVVSNENPAFAERQTPCEGGTCVLSDNYKFIKRFMKSGCAPIYYRNPRLVMERLDHPALNAEFKRMYDTLCGMRLFSGIKRYGREYETAYLCAAPCVLSLALQIKRRLDKGERVICLCHEDSVFADVLGIISEKAESVTYFPWSALAGDKYRPVPSWEKAVNEMPVFDCVSLGALDELMRYPVSEVVQSESKKKISGLAAVIATAWSDKTSEGVQNAVKKVLGAGEKVALCDPVPGGCGMARFCREVEKADENVIYKCFSMSGRLESKESMKPLARLMQGNKPLLAQIDKSGEKKWVYQKKINSSVLGEFYTAVCDFANDFCEYRKIAGDVAVDGADAFALYKAGEKRIEEMIDSKGLAR